MQSHAGPLLVALTAATCVGIACAADPGDPQKSTNAITGTNSSSSSSSGISSSSSSSSSSGISSSSSSSSSGISSSSSGISSSSSGGSSSGSSSGTVVSPTCLTKSVSTAPALTYETTDMPNATTGFTSVQQIDFTLNLTGGLSSVNLSDITIRYWFSADGNDVSQLFFVSYYSQVNNAPIQADITFTFASAPAANVTATSDSYLELGFSTAAPALGFGVTANIQAVVHGPGSGGYGDKFNESNDYSFNGTETAYGLNNNITYYVKGVLVGGCEPSGTGGGAGSSSSSSSSSSGSGSDSGSGIDANASGPADATTE